MALTSRHVLWDIWLPDSAGLRTPEHWQPCLHRAALDAGATILHERFHQFEPHGFTGYLLLAESHISIHTWPEERYAALDIFTCGPMQTKRILHRVRQTFQPVEEAVHEQTRGARPPIPHT